MNRQIEWFSIDLRVDEELDGNDVPAKRVVESRVVRSLIAAAELKRLPGHSSDRVEV